MKNSLLLFTFVFAFASLAFAQQKPRVDFAKKISEATPKPLPQEPGNKKPKSDAQDTNIRGKVRSIAEYSQEGKVRDISGEQYYDEHGNLLKEVDYQDAYPESVTVWGYIDNNRATRSGEIHYEEGEKPAPKHLILTARAEDNALNPNTPRDDRYSMRYSYKYDDQGRLIEQTHYQNNGEVWLRKTYAYNGNQKEVRDYDARGSEMSRTIYILDKNGDIAEERMFGADENDVTREFYTHVLDSQGNWIEEKVFEPKKARGKTVMKLLWTSYRTITYYP